MCSGVPLENLSGARWRTLRSRAAAVRARPSPLPGGSVLLIDESYNANPASMRAALAAMATVPRQAYPRRIAVMGDMLELGPAAAEFHRGLKDAVDAAGVDQVFACGPNMRLLFDELAAASRGRWCADVGGPAAGLVAALRAGDVVMIKGSLGTRMAPHRRGGGGALRRCRQDWVKCPTGPCWWRSSLEEWECSMSW